MIRLVDARGMRCPWPAIRAGRALRDATSAVEILADDPNAAAELRVIARHHGLAFVAVDPDRFRIGPDEEVAEGR